MRAHLILLLTTISCANNSHNIEKINSDAANNNTYESNDDDSDGIILSLKDAGIDSSNINYCKNGGCELGETCSNNSDCKSNVCRYDHICISERSCANHFGADTCGAGEVEQNTSLHESCCKSLPVDGYYDPSHPGQTVYLDKYEITAGRVRAFVQDITNQMGGKPDIKSWVVNHRPSFWNQEWEKFLPSDYEGGFITIDRLLLGDPRHDGETDPPPGVVLPPANNQTVNLGLNHQFGAQVYADLHGNNCGVFPGAYGFPTYYYSPDILIQNGEVPRSDFIGPNGSIAAQEALDVKSMNCITNVMLAVFCIWDGGQLATTDVLDYITANNNASDDVSGCGSQYDSHGELLGNIFTHTIQTGGRCANVIDINATFDAGDYLPVLGSFLNKHVYSYPNVSNVANDKSWQIAAPGRIITDIVKINNKEPWMDIAGNLNEAVINPHNGLFGIRHRGIGYGSSRSDLNVTLMPGETILRVQRPEAKSALVGGRCMRFK